MGTEVYFITVKYRYSDKTVHIDIRRWEEKVTGDRKYYVPTLEGVTFSLSNWKVILRHLTKLVIKWAKKGRNNVK